MLEIQKTYQLYSEDGEIQVVFKSFGINRKVLTNVSVLTIALKTGEILSEKIGEPDEVAALWDSLTKEHGYLQEMPVSADVINTAHEAMGMANKNNGANGFARVQVGNHFVEVHISKNMTMMNPFAAPYGKIMKFCEVLDDNHEMHLRVLNVDAFKASKNNPIRRGYR